MHNKKKYRYPDIDDTNVRLFVDFNEPYKGYWQKSEDFVLTYFNSLFKKNKFNSLLDIGCGDGSFIEKYIHNFNKITLIDCDEGRLNLAKERFKNFKNIKYLHETFLDANLKNQKFDVIVCSHILQFITTPSIQQFLKKIYEHLRPSGYFLILTAHSKSDNDIFTKLFINYNKIESKLIAESEFNNLRHNDEQVLPFHRFSIKNLKQLLKDFKLIELKIYRIVKEKFFLDKIIFRDKYFNLLPTRKKYGKYVYVLVRK